MQEYEESRMQRPAAKIVNFVEMPLLASTKTQWQEHPAHKVNGILRRMSRIT